MTINEEFAAFWAVYPRRVAKLAAQKAFIRARRQATLIEIVEGVQRYIHSKPSYADWCHPSTWLNQGRWLDEYDSPAVRRSASDWFDECQTLHGGQCIKRWNHEWLMREQKERIG